MLTPGEASALTLRSVKSTALASAAQLDLRRDERLAQGLPASTLATTPSPASVCSALSQLRWPQVGGHRDPWPPAGDIVSGPWSPFASHEHLQASHSPGLAPREAHQATASLSASPNSPVPQRAEALSDDKEARQVEEWAQQQASSDSGSEGTAPS